MILHLHIYVQYRLLDQLMTTLPTDGSEDLPLVLSACKFLDLLLVLQTEDFQVYVALWLIHKKTLSPKQVSMDFHHGHRRCSVSPR